MRIRRIKIKKEELRPGMAVRNTRTKNIGVVRGKALNPDELVEAHKDYVGVLVDQKQAKRPPRATWWCIENLELA